MNNNGWQHIHSLYENSSAVANSLSSNTDDCINQVQPVSIISIKPKVSLLNKGISHKSCITGNDRPYYREPTSKSVFQKKDKSQDYSSKFKSPLVPSSNASNLRRKFSFEEDEKLKQLIAIYGPKKWDSIALSMPGRTGRQCRDRFTNYLKPTLTNGPWTREEDILLEQKVIELGQHWNVIVKFFTGRSTNNIKNRWYTYLCRQKQTKSRLSPTRNNQINNQYFEYNLMSDNADINPLNMINNHELYNNGIISDLNSLNNQNNSISSFNNNATHKYHFKKVQKENNNNFSQKNVKNEKKILFPLICPPDGLIFPLNNDLFSFLDQQFVA